MDPPGQFSTTEPSLREVNTKRIAYGGACVKAANKTTETSDTLFVDNDNSDVLSTEASNSREGEAQNVNFPTRADRVRILESIISEPIKTETSPKDGGEINQPKTINENEVTSALAHQSSYIGEETQTSKDNRNNDASSGKAAALTDEFFDDGCMGSFFPAVHYGERAAEEEKNSGTFKDGSNQRTTEAFEQREICAARNARNPKNLNRTAGEEVGSSACQVQERAAAVANQPQSSTGLLTQNGPSYKDQVRASPEELAFATAVLVDPLGMRQTARQPLNDTRPLTYKDQFQGGTPINPGLNIREEEIQEQSLSSDAISVLGAETVFTLVKNGFPLGLVQVLENGKAKYPLRFWVVDNSGSMTCIDCCRIVEATKTTMTQCSRWLELKDATKYHAQLAGTLGATTFVRLLNNPGAEIGPQEFTVNNEQDVDMAKSILDTIQPEGATPLTEHILEIRERVLAVEEELKANGQKAVVVLATDGLPSDRFGESPDAIREEFINALKSLQILPVWVVVRLCTSDPVVLDFYLQLDRQLELPMEVIVSYKNEAKEIQKVNRWLNYALPLHRIREMGHHHRVLDVLDERLLTKDELLEFVELLFGNETFQDAPDVHTDWKGFASFLAVVVSKLGKQWNPLSQKLQPWINMKKLNADFNGGVVATMRGKLVGSMDVLVSSYQRSVNAGTAQKYNNRQSDGFIAESNH